MNTSLRTLPALVAVALLAASCGNMRSVSDVRDDVYYMPSTAPVTTSNTAGYQEEAPAPQQKAVPQDDYYDDGTAKQLGTSGSGGYYDMTYNDPYYYNTARFGFGTGLSGWQTGWNGPGWGMGMGYGMGIGMGMTMSMGMGPGWGGYYDPWFGYGGWGSPYGYRYNPWAPRWGWGGGYYDPWYGGGYGYGYGPYQGPYGGCYACYSPVVIGGGSGVVVGHRPSMNSNTAGGGQSGTVGQQRAALRDPVGLTRPAVERNRNAIGRPGAVERPVRTVDPTRNTYDRGTQPAQRPGTRPAEQPSRQQTTRPSRTPERGVIRGGGGTIDRGSSPSRGGGNSGGGSNGGGGNSGGGGSRSGGGGRPR